MAAGAGHGALERGLTVLASVAEARECRADDIARDTRMPLSTVYRYLRTLREMDFVEDRDGAYVPGRRLLDLSGRHLSHTRLVELGHGVLRELSEVTGETAVLMVRIGTQAMCLHQVESRKPIRVAFTIDELLPLYAGAGQRMLLAHAPTPVVRRALEEPVPPLTAATLDRAQVLTDIDRTRREGYLVSHGEYWEGAVAVAVPVIADGEIACSLTVAGPENRCPARWITDARGTLRTAGRKLAEALEPRPQGGGIPGIPREDGPGIPPG